ncbi:TylF/MycF/NovP-related O-methyltransferase [Microcoleus sp. B7-D4]|uniref:TylF/MycF/NovP-related O-methyltransferase n=1 Tax=Microcoleus sp. B7-D4 TaxID=2818696 RepID=UPI002FD19B8C
MTNYEPTQIYPLPQEPWVKLANGSELKSWSREDEIAYNQANRQAQKLSFYRQAFDFLTENQVKGDYHEYGCHRVRTFRMALTEARRHNLSDMKFMAFDSFEGLPEVESSPSVELWQKGNLLTTEEQFWSIIKDHDIYVENCQTIKGFYDQTLTNDLQAQFLQKEDKIALACIDCDLYESVVPVFQFIEPLLQEGSLLYIDEIFNGYKGSPVKGVSKAFNEFQEKSRFKFAPHIQIGWWGRSFIAYLDN